MEQFTVPDDIRWIGGDRIKDGGLEIETSYFKTIFELDSSGEVAKEAIIHISANERFCLYLNGKEILRGPCRGDHWHQFCDTIDIAPYLTVGKNVIAAKVTAYVPYEATNEERSNFGPIWAMSNSAGPMLVLWGELGAADISTGRAEWFSRKDSAIKWNLQQMAFWMGCTEDVDGAAIPHGWESEKTVSADFRPAKIKWGNGVRYGEIPKLFLYERPIKHLLRLESNALTVMQESKGFAFPLSGETIIPAGHTYEAYLDFGCLTTAFVHLRCKGGAGSSLCLLYSEAFTKYDGERRYKESRSDLSGELLGVIDTYRPGGTGEESYSPSWFRTFRFIKVTIKTGSEALRLYPLSFVETRYPLEDKVGFEATQPWVKKLWDISLRTLALCMHESYEDCPYYEQLQYTMDTRLQMLFNYVISNDNSLQLKAIHDYHSSMLPEGILQSRFPSKYTQVIPGFALHWVFMLKDYYMESGDAALLERYRPTMEAVLAWFKRKTSKKTALLENLGYWEFSDWTDAWSDISGVPRATLHGPSTIHNLLYACALETAAYIMDTLKLGSLADNYRYEKKGILEKVEELCWDEAKGLYREGPDFLEYSQHAQVWAVLSGLAKEKSKKIMAALLSDDTLIPCSFVMQYYVFRALEEAGMYKDTEKLWPMWQDLLDQDLSTVPEIPGKYTRSDCHAWGSLLLYELPRKFLGVGPLEAAYATVLIKPMALYMKEMSGEVPIPSGQKVRVKWRNDAGRFTLEGNSPVKAKVILPDGAEHDALGDFSFECRL